MNTVFTRGSLHFTADNNGGFLCQELAALPETFAQTHVDPTALMADIEEHINKFRDRSNIRCASKEERDQMSTEERLQKGQEAFDVILPGIRQRAEKLPLFQQFMFWLSDWWYYNPEIRTKVHFGETDFVYQSNAAMIRKNIMPLLPEQVRTQVADVEKTNIAVGFGHFAILFVMKNERVRRIVTDTQLFELRDVDGYIYLDIDADGKPIARSCCNRGGERAFFDGIRLMSHDAFQTCAPKTVIFDGGYKMNSTRCTIANGMLFGLIDSDDKVAQTTGAFMGMCDFSNTQAIDSYRMADESARRMSARNGVVMLDGQPLNPIGVFMPSRVKLLDNGFALYDFSDYEKVVSMRYDSVLVVDDKEQWIAQVVGEFGKEIKQLTGHATTDKRDALAAILETNPKAVLLDMHLTADEEFDGLWIARSLPKSGYKGVVILTSGYPEDHLRAMRLLIGSKVHAPGKNLAAIRKCLTDECRCS